MDDDLFTPLPEEGFMPHQKVEKVEAPELKRPDESFPILVRVQDTRPKHLDGGKAVLRPSLPYDNVSNMMSCFLDMYIGSRYAPSPSVHGCICHATVISGSVSLTAEGQSFLLLERDALRFKADQPYHFENFSNSIGRLLLEYQYLHEHL